MDAIKNFAAIGFLFIVLDQGFEQYELPQCNFLFGLFGLDGPCFPKTGEKFYLNRFTKIGFFARLEDLHK